MDRLHDNRSVNIINESTVPVKIKERCKYVLSHLLDMGLSDKLNVFQGEEGLCISLPCSQSMIEILDNKYELYVGEGHGVDPANYKTYLFVYDTVEEFTEHLDRLPNLH